MRRPPYTKIIARATPDLIDGIEQSMFIGKDLPTRRRRELERVVRYLKDMQSWYTKKHESPTTEFNFLEALKKSVEGNVE